MIQGRALLDFMRENNISPKEVADGYFDKHPEDLDTFIEARARFYNDLNNEEDTCWFTLDYIRDGCNQEIKSIKDFFAGEFSTFDPNKFYNNYDDEDKSDDRFDIPIINKKD